MIEESLKIKATRAWRGEVVTIEDPEQTEENLHLHIFPDNTKGGEQSPPFVVVNHFFHCKHY